MAQEYFIIIHLLITLSQLINQILKIKIISVNQIIKITNQSHILLKKLLKYNRIEYPY